MLYAPKWEQEENRERERYSHEPATCPYLEPDETGPHSDYISF
jgi:hypothetical protein